SPEQENATTDPEKIHDAETSPESIDIPSEKPTPEKPTSDQPTPEQHTSEQNTEHIPEQNPEQVLENTVVLNDSDFDSSTKFENFPVALPITNPELVKICNNIFLKMKKLHKLRYSYTEPYQYLEMWDTLRNEINKDLDKIQNGDLNELMTFQKNTREWVEGVNKEFETAQLRKNGRLLIDNFFDETTVTNQVWKENIGNC
ncbi:hypothetical protein A2U01_0031715, partial [Trifolium medium]|nr:hypothetical protein [Trifolium medium]